MVSSRPRPRPAPSSRKPPRDQAVARALGVAGVVGLFVVLIVVIALLGGSGGGDGGGEAAAQPTAAPTRTPTPSPQPTPTRVPLTPDEKLDRQDDIDVVRSRGFTLVSRADWKPDDTLQVLVGRSSAGGELAFFFVDNQYLGNDSTDASGRVRVRRTDDVSVTLRYGIYAPGDASGRPSGTPVDVEFRYEGGKVTPATAIPDVTQRRLSG